MPISQWRKRLAPIGVVIAWGSAHAQSGWEMLKPETTASFRGLSVVNDRVVWASGTRGTVTYAKSSMPNSRSSQLFINLGDNSMLDQQGFAPFAEVIEGMDVVDKLYSGYGDEPTGRQPEIAAEGNAFLNRTYPKLDFIRTAKVVK